MFFEPHPFDSQPEVEPIALDTKHITQDEEDAILLTRLSCVCMRYLMLLLLMKQQLQTRFEDVKNEDLLMAWRVSLKREVPDANPVCPLLISHFHHANTTL